MASQAPNNPASPRISPHILRTTATSPTPASTGSVLADKLETTPPEPVLSNQPHPPVTARNLTKDGRLAEDTDEDERLMALEFEDGSVHQGFSFGAQRSVSGEMVFQTGTKFC